MRQLNALAARGTQYLTFLEPQPPTSGQYTYSLKFGSPHDDANNENQRIARDVTFAAAAAAPVCPTVMCQMYCATGYETGPDGCPTCACKAP